MSLPTPIQITHVSKTGTPCYVLIYNSATNAVLACKYGDFNYTTPGTNRVLVAETYAGLSAQAAAAGITGLPPQKDGQP